MPRKYYFMILGLFVLLSCAVAAGVITIVSRHHRLLRERKLESILSSTQTKIDSCTIQKTTWEIDSSKLGKRIKKKSTVDITGDDAQILSDRFASAVRKYQRKIIIPGMLNFAYKYKITFQGQDLIWDIQFDRFADRSFVEYRIKKPSPFRSVAIMLNSKAAPELLPLLRNALKDANDVNQQ